jgi:hypothetical protein
VPPLVGHQGEYTHSFVLTISPLIERKRKSDLLVCEKQSLGNELSGFGRCRISLFGQVPSVGVFANAGRSGVRAE